MKLFVQKVCKTDDEWVNCRPLPLVDLVGENSNTSSFLPPPFLWLLADAIRQTENTCALNEDTTPNVRVCKVCTKTVLQKFNYRSTMSNVDRFGMY